MKHFARSVQGMFKTLHQAAADRSDTQRVQDLMDELEDPQPNSLLVNLATGFPSALLCVLAAGALAGALAGRQVGGGTIAPAQAADAAPLVLAWRDSAPVPPGPLATAPGAAPATAQATAQSFAQAGAFNGALSGRQARLERLEMESLQGGPGAR